jgi:hypothetical protein
VTLLVSSTLLKLQWIMSGTGKAERMLPSGSTTGHCRRHAEPHHASTIMDRYGEPERGGGSEWEPIKILLKGDGDSNKTNTASNTFL